MSDLNDAAPLVPTEKSGTFINLFSLWYLARNCIYNLQDFDTWDFNVNLSDLGNEIFNKLKRSKNTKEIPHGILKYAIFLELYHQAIYVSLDDDNIKIIENFITSKILSNEIIIPWTYERLLYDKYFDEFSTQEENLSFDETLKLLNGTPQGVFQVDKYIFGPLGVIKSKISRLIAPKNSLNLWHCSDPACSSFHVVNLLNDNESVFAFLLHTIGEYNQDKEFEDFKEIFLDEVIEDKDYNNDQSATEVYKLVVDAFGENDMRLILKLLIDEYELRNKLPSSEKYKASSKSIVSSLNKQSCVQLILLCEDNYIIKAIDQLILEKLIIIPPTEIRQPHIKKTSGNYHIYHQCNKLGVRAQSRNHDLSIVRLKRLIKSVYEDPYLKSQLEWKLRPYSGDTLDAKIEKYISKSDPKTIINETIMTGPVQLEKAWRMLPGYYKMPDDFEQESYIIDKMLWKLGFDINIFPEDLTKFWKRLRKFKDIVTRSSRYNEEDKEEIRSAAVNLFVSLEQILEHALSFAVWLLLSDHYIDTKFTYVYEDAREFMAGMLNGFEMSSGEKIAYDKNGKNTLFPLVAGFDALVSICDKLLSEGNEKYRRPEIELPSFHGNDSIMLFPFMSKKMLFDISASDYEKFSSITKNISKEFSKTHVLSIRNRLQHKRDDFPAQQEIIAACDSIDKIISILENSNVYPNVYLFKSFHVDAYKRDEFTYYNYKSVEISVVPTPEYALCDLPGYYDPQIIIPIIKIGSSNNPMRFLYKERSDYQQFWKNYPRRKKIEEQDAHSHIEQAPEE